MACCKLFHTRFAIVCASFGIAVSLQAQPKLYAPGGLALRDDAAAFLAPPSQKGVATNFWRVEDGMDLFYFSSGKGDEVILFVHGGPGIPPAKPHAGLELLNDDFQTYYYHQRGGGKSTRPFDKFESNNFVANLPKLIEALGVQQHVADIERIRRILKRDKLLLVGHSFGAFIAALYAVEFPSRVEKLVLISPAEMLKMPIPGGGLYEAVKQQLPEGKLKQAYGNYLMRFFGGFMSVFTKNEQELATLNNEFGKYYAAALEASGLPATSAEITAGHASGWGPYGVFFSLGMQYDHTKALNKITCPVLILTGEKDFTNTQGGLKMYSDNLASCKVQVIKDAGHFSFIEQPEVFAKRLHEFLK